MICVAVYAIDKKNGEFILCHDHKPFVVCLDMYSCVLCVILVYFCLIFEFLKRVLVLNICRLFFAFLMVILPILNISFLLFWLNVRVLSKRL